MRLAPLDDSAEGDVPPPRGLARVSATAVIFAVLADLTLSLLVVFASTFAAPGLFLPAEGEAASPEQLLSQLAAGLAFSVAGGFVAGTFSRVDPQPSALAAAGVVVVIGALTLPKPPPLWFTLLGWALTFPAYGAGAALVGRAWRRAA